MRNESVPTPPSPETPPLAPYDPPDPAPQARAWRRAIKVVLRQDASHAANSSAPHQGGNRHYENGGRDRHQHQHV